MKTYCINKIPSEFALDVTQLAELYQMKLVKAVKKGQDAKKDVMLVSTIGYTIMIDRLTLANNFVAVTGKPITMRALKYDQKYTVMRVVPTGCKAVRVKPTNNTGFTDAYGNDIKDDSVYVLTAKKAEEATIDGKIDFSGANVIPYKLFRKLYVINKVSNSLLQHINVVSDGAIKQDIDNKTVKVTHTDTYEAVHRVEDPAIDRTKELPIVEHRATHKETEIGKWVATATLYNHNGELIGYQLLYCGQTYVEKSTKNTAILAKMGCIENLKYVPADKVTGRSGYLAGVGMSIKDLEKKTVDEKTFNFFCN